MLYATALFRVDDGSFAPYDTPKIGNILSFSRTGVINPHLKFSTASRNEEKKQDDLSTMRPFSVLGPTLTNDHDPAFL